MIKRITKKKFMVALFSLVALLLIYLVPTDEISLKEELTYVDSEVLTHEIYMLDKNNMLARTKVPVTDIENKENLVQELVGYLIKNSKYQNKVPSGFLPFLPEDTKINKLIIDNNILKIDFSSELLDIDKEYEIKMIESLVFTLTGIDGIDKLIIYIDDEILTKLPKNNITIPGTLDKSIGINKEYNISSFNDINKVTVYYIDKFNDDIYYVPVTKYVNDSRDKINIIIDELSSNLSSNTNLMSFLNSNTELLKVDMLEDNLELVFNNYIFDNINEKSILEEVIYTICLSARDNYTDIESVSFIVEDEEILKSVLKTID